MVEQLQKESYFHKTHGHTRILIVGIHWPSFFTDGRPYAAGKLLRDLSLVQQILATLHWPDSPDEVLGAIDRTINAVDYTPVVKKDLMFLIDLCDGDEETIDLNALPEEELLRLGESTFGQMLDQQQEGKEITVKKPSAVPDRPLTFNDETQAAAAATASEVARRRREKLGQKPQPRRGPPFFGLFRSLGNLAQHARRGFVEVTRNAERMIFGKFEQRAILIGSTGLHAMLTNFMKAADRRGPTAPPVRFHAVGHSLGCHVMSGAVCGPPGGVCSLPRRMHTLCLIEPAVHTDAMTVGHKYHRLVGADPPTAASPVGRALVAGALVITTSETDMALHNYSIWNGPAMGTKGAVLSPPAKAQAVDMRPADESYELTPGSVTNVNASKYIAPEEDASLAERMTIGSHLNIYGPEVCHLVWSAAAVPVDPSEEAL